MNKRVLIVFIATVFAISALYGAGVVTVKKTQDKTYKQVQFSHDKHKKLAKCKQCHHKGKVSDSCAAKGCHQGPAGTKKIHKLCITECHKKKGGPTKCKDCHKY